MEHPRYEIKLNSAYYDEVEYNESTEDSKLILQQFESDPEQVYICLNGLQIHMKLDELYRAIEFLKQQRVEP